MWGCQNRFEHVALLVQYVGTTCTVPMYLKPFVGKVANAVYKEDNIHDCTLHRGHS